MRGGRAGASPPARPWSAPSPCSSSSSRSSSPTRRTRACPSSPPTSSPPRSPTPTPWSRATRSGSAASASARSRPSSRSRARDGSVNAKVDMELNQDVDPLPGRLDRDRPLALGARPQVPGAPARQLRRGLRGGRHDAAQRRHARAGRDRPGLQHLRRPHPRRDPGQPDRVRQRARRPRPGAERRDRRPAPAGRAPRARDAQPRLARDRTSPASSAGLSARRPRSRRSPSSQGQLFVDLETTFGAFADVARPFIQETISKSPRDRGHRDRDAARDPAVPGQHRGPLQPTCVPASPRCAPSPTTSCGSVTVGVKALRLSPEFNAQLDPTAQALLDFNNNANVREGLDDLDASSAQAQPLLAHRRPGPVRLQLRLAAVPQRRQPPRLRRRRRHLPALHRARARRTGPTARAARAPRRPTAAASSRQLPALQPVPEHGLARAVAA